MGGGRRGGGCYRLKKGFFYFFIFFILFQFFFIPWATWLFYKVGLKNCISLNTFFYILQRADCTPCIIYLFIKYSDNSLPLAGLPDKLGNQVVFTSNPTVY